MKRKYVITLTGVATAGAVLALVPALANASSPTSVSSHVNPTLVSRHSGSTSASLGTTPYLTLAAAQKASTVAMKACLDQGYPVTVTVVDRDGLIINQQRADTATGATVQTSLGKAYAAVGFQVPTSGLQEAAKTNPGAISIPGFIILPGGLPVTIDGKVVAGFGVSGAPAGTIDEGCATKGVNSIS